MGRQLLIVDDDASLREALSEWFGEYGYGVTAVSSAAAALTWLAETDDSCVVLSDVRMVGMDGFELARTIEKRFPEKDARVILFTGWTGSEHPCKDLRSVVALVRKPFDVEDLSELVNRTMTTSLAAAGQ